ncbi:MAG: response regulator [Spirochaetaceae bacterium]
MIRVVITDDHELIRSGFGRLIERDEDLTLAAEAGDAGETFDTLETVPCDVLVLDISLPDQNGLDVLKELRGRFPKLPVLVLSMHSEEQYALRALQAGALGYITKNNASQELARAIRKVADGSRYVGERTAEKLASTLGPSGAAEPHERLSDREYQILALIGSGMSVRDVADELSLSIHTVNTYRRRVLEKLGLRTTTQIVRFALEHDITP